MPSPSSRERTQRVPLSLVFVCQSKLTECFAELTEFAAELNEFSLPKTVFRPFPIKHISHWHFSKNVYGQPMHELKLSSSALPYSLCHDIHLESLQRFLVAGVFRVNMDIWLTSHRVNHLAHNTIRGNLTAHAGTRRKLPTGFAVFRCLLLLFACC